MGKTLVTGPAGDEDNPKAVLFLGADNKLIHPTVVNNSSNAASYIKGFRAYFQLKGQAALARKATLNFGGNNTTGITLIDNGQLRSDNAVYDLQGRQVVAQPTQKGVYIVNCKKINHKIIGG